MTLARTLSVALVGNPNTGKTTLFNALAGMNQRVGNYAGVTVETKKGRCRHAGQEFEVIDLPGTYSLSARSPDEMVAVDVILGRQDAEQKPDLVISIVDASNLERNLFLTTQVLDLGVPVVVALNMMDVAEGLGVTIDVARLQERLGLAVVPLQANKGKGIEQLKQTVVELLSAPSPPGSPGGEVWGEGGQSPSRDLKATSQTDNVLASSVPLAPNPSPRECRGRGENAPTFPSAFETEVAAMAQRFDGDYPPALARRLLLDVGGQTERLALEAKGAAFADQLHEARQRLAKAGCGVPGIEARTRYAWIRKATEGCVKRPDVRKVTATDRLDRILTHRIWGTLVFLAVMLVVFTSIFYFAKPLMDLIDAGRGWLGHLVKGHLEPGPLRSLLVEGVIKGVGAVVVFVPQILILFAFLAVLEDCGYMARAAFLMDRLMSKAGLNGKSFIPMLSSLACAVPGIMSARVIENRRDRLATILVAPLMSCAARLPVYTLLVGAFLTEGHAWWVPGVSFFCLYMIGLILAPVVAFALKRTLLKGETPAFVMEMPLYKIPSPALIARRSFEAGLMFLQRAGTMILASMVVVWALLYFPTTSPDGESYDAKISSLEKALAPKVEQLEDPDLDFKKLTTDPDVVRYRELEAELEKAIGQPANRFGDVPGIEVSKKLAEAKAIPNVARFLDARQLEWTIQRERDEINRLTLEWKSNSLLGRTGKAIEPVVRPLGWDWRISVAALASFPAREVVVGVLGIVFGEGEVDSKEDSEMKKLGDRLRDVEDGHGRKVFSIPVALSLMVFFALCAQCVSTLVVIRRETNSWAWPVFTFVYMTALAYVGALVTYQVGMWFV